jgi:hypothetical protein
MLFKKNGVVTKATKTTIDEMFAIKEEQNKLSARMKVLSDSLKLQMESEGVKRVSDDYGNIGYTNATIRTTVNVAKLKEENLSLYKKLISTSKVSSKLTIKLTK